MNTSINLFVTCIIVMFGLSLFLEKSHDGTYFWVVLPI